MKKIIFIFAFLVGFTTIAQDKKDTITSNWKKVGNFSFLFNQSSFSNWVSGGDNTVAVNFGINYDFNYSKDSWTWNNRIIMRYGLSNTKSNGTRKNDDSFEFNSLVGKTAEGHWSYSFFINLRSQFTNGYDYKADPDATTPVSSFFSPGYLTFGPGMLWEKSDTFKFNLSPATTKLTFVSDDLAGSYGTEAGETSLLELGFYASLYYKATIMKNVSMENIINVYTNYLFKPQNIDINYQLNFVMQINKYLSTNLSFQTIIDDDASKRVQFKEVFGLGGKYVF